MKLYLVQHGEATTNEVNPSRPLTEKGKQDVSNTAKFLKSAGIKVDIIWHSTKTRAMETAHIMTKELLPKEGTQQRDGLAPNDLVNKWAEEIVSQNKDLMIVGHLPFLQRLTSLPR